MLVKVGDAFIFSCPGCKLDHKFEKCGRWIFDGDFVKPTIKPSLLVIFTGKDNKAVRCHSKVIAGQAAFLTDCTHKLAGTTVPLPPYPST